MRRVAVLLSVQRALLGAIGPDLRDVTVGWSASEIRLRCLYDQPVEDPAWEAMGAVEAQLLGDFPTFQVHLELEHYARPLVLAERTLDTWVYARRELRIGCAMDNHAMTKECG